MKTANREIIKEALLREFKRVSTVKFNKELTVFQVMFDGYRIEELRIASSYFQRKIYFSLIRLSDNLVQIEASFDCEYLFQFNCPIHELRLTLDSEITMNKVSEYWIA